MSSKSNKKKAEEMMQASPALPAAMTKKHKHTKHHIHVHYEKKFVDGKQQVHGEIHDHPDPDDYSGNKKEPLPQTFTDHGAMKAHMLKLMDGAHKGLHEAKDE